MYINKTKTKLQLKHTVVRRYQGQVWVPVPPEKGFRFTIESFGSLKSPVRARLDPERSVCFSVSCVNELWQCAGWGMTWRMKMMMKLYDTGTKVYAFIIKFHSPNGLIDKYLKLLFSLCFFFKYPILFDFYYWDLD